MTDKKRPSDSWESVWIHADENDREEYIERHGILHPEETTEEHLPDTDNNKVREIDLEALSIPLLSGKWNVFRSPSEVDSLWSDVVKRVEEGDVYQAKVSTARGRDEEGGDEHVVVVYTPNYFDEEDVFRVRDVLRDECGVDERIYYKPDWYTANSIYRDTAEEMGLPGASRYSK